MTQPTKQVERRGCEATKHLRLRARLFKTSRAHNRAANHWAFNRRCLWSVTCSNKLMRHKPLRARLRAYLKLLRAAA